MASSVHVRLASRAYDGVLPILHGAMKRHGFEFDLT
jgi:hypothetical protein